MRLLYVWVENYKCINKQEFAFSTKYNITFNKDTYKLSIEVNEESIDAILYGKNITTTAIVGNNGAGKSTVLDLVRGIIFDSNFKQEATGFMIWEVNDKIHMYSFMDKPIIYAGINQPIESLLDDKFGLIYFSEVLDFKYYINDFDDREDVYTELSEDNEIGISRFRNRDWSQYNISTSYLLRQNKNNVLGYFHNETRKQIALIKVLQNKTENVLPFSLPNSLKVELKFLGVDVFNDLLDDRLSNYFYKGLGHKGENNTNSFTIGLIKEMGKIHERKSIMNANPVSINEIVMWDVFVEFIYNLLSYRVSIKEKRDDYTYVDDILGNIFTNSLPDEFVFFNKLRYIFEDEQSEIEELADYISFYRELKWFIQKKGEVGMAVEFKIPNNLINSLKPSIIKMLAENRVNDFDLFNSLIYKEDDEKKSMHYEEWYMDNLGWRGVWSIDDFMNLYAYYERIAMHVDFFMFSWGMSSGESSIFSLFARLSYIIEKLKQDIGHMIVILDELDSNYHPTWQQSIMKSLTDFIRKMYPNLFFQLIITTHSPVLLSDIPRSNTIFMKDKEQSKRLGTIREQTFAANIATLYYDSFFMENGSIGELSKRSIFSLIDSMESLDRIETKEKGVKMRAFVDNFLKNQFDETKELPDIEYELRLKQIKKLINTIGEDIWRYKLKSQFDSFNFYDNEPDKMQDILLYVDMLRNTKGEGAVDELLKKIKGAHKEWFQ